ncbi:MAG: isoleucine--tRNA ligase [Candidatus Omnitrophica bacterium]|nr:isoleucine--tRNA ligase [Candidatus Omnitrophota bacterium]
MEQSSKSYKNTVFLPNTPFPMKGSLPEREPAWLKEWEAQGLTAALRKKSAGKPKYVLHDGPPYANGNIHIGHALNKVLKDIVVKYKTMNGFDVPYIPGWDCHGLPIEHALFKEMGKRKEEVERGSFRREARAYAERFVAIQREEFKRLGILGDWEHPYKTMDFSYQAVIADSFLKLYEAGYIYRALKPVPWCFECETALADAELEYQDKTSQSIYVAFELSKVSARNSKLLAWVSGRPVFVVIWTTTPWTLPANVAMAFHPDLVYSIVSSGEKVFVLAKDLVTSLAQKFGWTEVKELGSLTGSELAGIEAQRPLAPEAISVGVTASYVSNVDGSGIVHIAPGHGEEDFEVGRKFSLPVLSPVDSKGRFTQEFALHQGLHVFKANKEIVSLLKEKGMLLAGQDHSHSYPHCWRCRQPIIFRATNQWFLKVDHKDLRKKTLETIDSNIQFTPAWGKNRIGSMMESRPDWCLSRQRYWGVPIPMVTCTNCHEIVYTPDQRTKVREIFAAKGADAWFEEPTGNFLPACTTCKCASPKLEKETDIIDVWFDSGVSAQAVLKGNPGLAYPADLYLEGSDQHRGWFQTSLIAGTALDGHAPFRGILTHGFVVDGEGKKMSKSAGNVIAPQQVFSQFGADVLRLWVSSCDYSVDVRLSKEILERMVEAYRRIRNTFRYLLGNLADFSPACDCLAPEAMTELDRWAVAKTMRLLEEVTASYEHFRFHEIYRLVHSFATTFLSNFYLDVLKDRLYTFARNDAKRRSSQTALFYILRILVKILAPILPFTTHEVWKAFSVDPENLTVHQSHWPRFEKEWEESVPGKDWEDLLAIRDLANAKIEEKRAQGKLGSSLEAALEISTSSVRLLELLKKHHADLKTIFIVSDISLERSSEEAGSESVVLPSDGSSHALSLTVGRAQGSKCERCWNYSARVGSFPEHPTLCQRCIDIVRAFRP